MSLLPAELSTGKVHGRFIIGVIDGADPDQDPDAIPAAGKVVFKASVPYIPVPVTAEGPVTLMKGPITGVLDEEGYLSTPYPEWHDDAGKPMYRGVKLLATDDPDGMVTDWTWSAEVQLDKVGATALPVPAFSFALPSNSEVDLTTLVKVPSSPGYGLPQAEAAALRSEAASLASAASASASAQSAADAEAVAQSVRADAAAGVFDGLSAYEVWLGLGNTGTEADFINWLKGAKGDPGGWVNATISPALSDANTFTAAGIFYVPGSTDPNRKNFPVPGGGDLKVTRDAVDSILQEFTPMPWSSAAAKGFYRRTLQNTTWGAWQWYSSLRFDKTVGTAVYAWDSVANADRLIAGETDVYTIAPIGGFTGKITIQRSGNVVTVSVDNLIDTAATSTHFAAMPTGFRPPVDGDSVGIILSGTTLKQVLRSGSNLRVSTRSGTLNGSFSYITKDGWPTATPPNSLTFRNGYAGAATVQDLGDGLALLTLQDIDGSAATLSGAINFPAAFLPFDSPRLSIVYDDGTAPGALADRDTAQIYLSAGKKMTGTQRFICRFAPRVSLAFRPEYSGTAYIAKSGSTVLMEIMSLDTTAGGAGLSPFAVPVAYRPAPNGAKFTCEWTDGTSNQYDISTTTGQFYPPVGKILKSPVRFMWPATS